MTFWCSSQFTVGWNKAQLSIISQTSTLWRCERERLSHNLCPHQQKRFRECTLANYTCVFCFLCQHWFNYAFEWSSNFPCCLGGHHHPVPSQRKPPKVLAPLPPPYPQTAEDWLRHLHHQPGTYVWMHTYCKLRPGPSGCSCRSLSSWVRLGIIFSTVCNITL